MPNKTIRNATLLAKLTIGLCILLFSFFLIAFIYWHFDREAFALVDMKDGFKAGFGVDGIQLYQNENQLPSDAIRMSELSHLMMYWLFFRISLFTAISILIIRSVLGILRSISSLRTFYEENIKHLKVIALLAFIAFFFSTFNFIEFNGESQLYFKTALGPLMLAAVSLVLAEVFRAGKNLLEDKNLII